MTKRLLPLLVSAVLSSPAAYGAELNTNLIVNPGFEEIVEGQSFAALSFRFTSQGDDRVFPLVGWNDANGDADDNYAARYGQHRGIVGKQVHLIDGGNRHYFGGFGTSQDEVNIVQAIDLSEGPTAFPAAFGSAQFFLSGWFTSGESRPDSSTLQAEFFNANGTLATHQVGGTDFVQAVAVSSGERGWAEDSICHLPIPQGTEGVRIQLISDGVSESNRSWKGFVDNVELQLYAPANVPGDFDSDGKLSPADANILGHAIASDEAFPGFSLDGDCTATQADLAVLLDSANVLNGDLDFNGQVDFGDFLIFAENFDAEGDDVTWSKGDLVPNGTINFSDFLVLTNNFGASAQPTEGVASVPEPAGLSLLLAALLLLPIVSRSKSHR